MTENETALEPGSQQDTGINTRSGGALQMLKNGAHFLLDPNRTVLGPEEEIAERSEQ
jgi:hypothetical protein